ncbi:MAG TPA: hypothetical protein VFX98_20020 [Longimicrobiaceae bacterium]|nr:hypothetical protein [Longimicrobiaceae bacterium]
MNRSVHLRPDELSHLIVEAAVTADEQGFWHEPRPIAEDAVQHLVRFLGVLLAGDDDVDLHELRVFGDVFAAASGERPSEHELREAAMEAVEMASDPDALHEFLATTPPFLDAVLAMDRARGTRNADQVVTALSGLGLAVLAADGRAELEEESVFTIHLNHLRGEVETLG